MSPHFHFQLDRTGYERCLDLLAAAGLPFTEEGRHSFARRKDGSAITDVQGHLSTPGGAVRCRLRSSWGRSFSFTVTILELEQLDVLDDVKRVLADHLVE